METFDSFYDLFNITVELFDGFAFQFVEFLFVFLNLFSVCGASFANTFCKISSESSKVTSMEILNHAFECWKFLFQSLLDFTTFAFKFLSDGLDESSNIVLFCK